MDDSVGKLVKPDCWVCGKPAILYLEYDLRWSNTSKIVKGILNCRASAGHQFCSTECAVEWLKGNLQSWVDGK